MFAALGLRFSPRIRDLSDQLLYGMEGVGTADGPRAKAFARDLLRGKVIEKLILRHWDDIRRVVGSLKLGRITAFLFVSRLEAKPRKSGPARAVQEYGQLQKTLFLLRRGRGPQAPHRPPARQGRGPQRPQAIPLLRRRGQDEAARSRGAGRAGPVLQPPHRCRRHLEHRLYYRKVLDQLVREGHPIRDEDMVHLWPTRHAHIIPYGRYAIDADGDPEQSAQADGYV